MNVFWTVQHHKEPRDVQPYTDQRKAFMIIFVETCIHTSDEMCFGYNADIRCVCWSVCKHVSSGDGFTCGGSSELYRKCMLVLFFSPRDRCFLLLLWAAALVAEPQRIISLWSTSDFIHHQQCTNMWRPVLRLHSLCLLLWSLWIFVHYIFTVKKLKAWFHQRGRSSQTFKVGSIRNKEKKTHMRVKKRAVITKTVRSNQSDTPNNTVVHLLLRLQEKQARATPSASDLYLSWRTAQHATPHRAISTDVHLHPKVKGHSSRMPVLTF